MNATKINLPTNVCAHTNSLRQNCQRNGWFRVQGHRGCFCAQHAEIKLGRALSKAEKGEA